MKIKDFELGLESDQSVITFLFYITPHAVMDRHKDHICWDLLRKLMEAFKLLGVFDESVNEHALDTLAEPMSSITEDMRLAIIQYLRYYGRPKTTRVYLGVMDDIIMTIEEEYNT